MRCPHIMSGATSRPTSASASATVNWVIHGACMNGTLTTAPPEPLRDRRWDTAASAHPVHDERRHEQADERGRQRGGATADPRRKLEPLQLLYQSLCVTGDGALHASSAPCT